jgi:hypothetical protein
MLSTGMLWTLIIGGLLLVESAIVTWGNVQRARFASVTVRELPVGEEGKGKP